jgi:DNA repair protein RecO (recombination protein O)
VRSTAYGETDRILTLFTRDQGKISVLARGAAKSTKRFGGALEPFSLIETTVRPTTKRIWPLQEARQVKVFIGLSQNLRRLESASFLLELTREVLPEHQPEPALFDLVIAALTELEQSAEEEIAKLAISAELKIMAISGTAVAVDSCNACGRPVPTGKRVTFNPLRGGIVCRQCGGGPLLLSAGTQAALANLARMPLDRTSEIELTSDQADELTKALDQFLEQHLGHRFKTKVSSLAHDF